MSIGNAPAYTEYHACARDTELNLIKRTALLCTDLNCMENSTFSRTSKKKTITVAAVYKLATGNLMSSSKQLPTKGTFVSFGCFTEISINSTPAPHPDSPRVRIPTSLLEYSYQSNIRIFVAWEIIGKIVKHWI